LAFSCTIIDKLLLLVCNLLVLVNIIPNDTIIKKASILMLHMSNFV
jgi:hypothetical protein